MVPAQQSKLCPPQAPRWLLVWIFAGLLGRTLLFDGASPTLVAHLERTCGAPCFSDEQLGEAAGQLQGGMGPMIAKMMAKVNGSR